MIEGISEVRRLPRLGVIRLGEKATTEGGKEYPKKLEYFNLKDAPGVAAIFGAKPKSIEIMLPHEDINVFFPQWRKAYGKSSGLFCKGDGRAASRVRFGTSDGKPRFEGDKPHPAGFQFDPEGEKFIKAQGLKVEVGARFDMPCLGSECSFTQKKVCKPLAQMMFLIPKVPGVGVFQISTGSFNGMVDINSYVEIIRGIAGRVSMIPLVLSLVPKKVTVNGKSTGIFHLKLEYKGKMVELAKYRNVNYLSADLLPQIEHETPEDMMPHAGAKLDEVLNGGPARIEGPAEAPPAGTDSFTLKDKFLAGCKDKSGASWIEFRGPQPDQVYRISKDVAEHAKKNLKVGDVVKVVWGTEDGNKRVMEMEKVQAETTAGDASKDF